MLACSKLGFFAKPFDYISNLHYIYFIYNILCVFHMMNKNNKNMNNNNNGTRRLVDIFTVLVYLHGKYFGM